MILWSLQDMMNVSMSWVLLLKWKVFIIFFQIAVMVEMMCGCYKAIGIFLIHYNTIVLCMLICRLHCQLLLLHLRPERTTKVEELGSRFWIPGQRIVVSEDVPVAVLSWNGSQYDQRRILDAKASYMARLFFEINIGSWFDTWNVIEMNYCCYYVIWPQSSNRPFL